MSAHAHAKILCLGLNGLNQNGYGSTVKPGFIMLATFLWNSSHRYWRLNKPPRNRKEKSRSPDPQPLLWIWAQTNDRISTVKGLPFSYTSIQYVEITPAVLYFYLKRCSDRIAKSELKFPPSFLLAGTSNYKIPPCENGSGLCTMTYRNAHGVERACEKVVRSVCPNLH